MVETLIHLKEEKTLKVLLSCSAGLTTSMFVENLNSVAQILNLYYQFDAVSYLSIYEEVENYDVIGIATPGIVQDNKKLKDSKDLREIDIQNEFEHKYNIKVFVYNNANAAVVGFSLEHPEYQNIIFHSQPFGYGIGGQGIISNGHIDKGKNGIAGEIRYFLRRMQLSNDANQLALTEVGALELLTKSLLPSIAILGPEAIAISSPMTPHIPEIKESLKSFIAEEFLPEFYFIKDPSSYMLSGITQLCMDYLDYK